MTAVQNQIGAIENQKSAVQKRARLRPWRGSSSADDYFAGSVLRLEQFEHEIRAFTHRNERQLRESIEKAARDSRDGKAVAPLAGMPVAVKEIIDSADFPTEHGSTLYRERRPTRNATCLQRLVDAGALVLGMTTSTPFACGTTTVTANPHRLEHTPGGSSAGSGAAVGAGFVPVALATQTGASTLRPASYCGAYGYKPSHGRYPMDGVHPLAETLDDVGVIAASVNDIERVDAVIAARTTDRLPAPAPTSVRIGWVRLDAGEEPDPASWAALNRVRRHLTGVGMHGVTPVQSEDLAAFDSLVRGSTDRMFDIFAAESAPILAQYVNRPDPEEDPRLAELVTRARTLDTEDLAAAYELRARLRAAHAQLADSVDVLATLATVNPAPAGHARTGSRTMPATSSFLGLPAMSLPVMHVDGMPLGLQLIGFEDRDEELFALARTIDAAFSGHSVGLSDCTKGTE
ncbi:amidase [Microbacterium sp. NPDC076911]|uniref:amidase n=1 Tax=Microbacterium sp. NPDC076911 TaxID=3154958 RepID=UPI003448CF2D